MLVWHSNRWDIQLKLFNYLCIMITEKGSNEKYSSKKAEMKHEKSESKAEAKREMKMERGMEFCKGGKKK